MASGVPAGPITRILSNVISAEPAEITLTAWRDSTHRSVAQKLQLMFDCALENTRHSGSMEGDGTRQDGMHGKHERNRSVWMLCVGGSRHLEWRQVFPVRAPRAIPSNLVILLNPDLCPSEGVHRNCTATAG